MDWETLLPSLPESICSSQNAWEHPMQGKGEFFSYYTPIGQRLIIRRYGPDAMLSAQQMRGTRRPFCSSHPANG